MSCLFCCFKSLSLCGFRDCMMNTVAFRPPTERKYELNLERQDLVKGSVFKMKIHDSNNSSYIAQDMEGLDSSIVWLDTRTNKRIPALFIDNSNSKSNFVILYSHGNSTDLGRMYKPLQELSYTLNVHVLAYEYNGYGPTQGGTGEYEVMFGIIAAYEFLVERLCFKWQNIVLYGRSIGSGPSVFLASHPNYPVGGVLLHSPIASGLRVFKFDMLKTDKLDLFPNCDFIEHVKAPVFIIHGDTDAEVPIAHGKLIASRCKNLFSPWWVTGGNHNDIDYTFRRAYFLRIAKFLKHCRDSALDKTSEELDQLYKVTPWWEQSDHIYMRKIVQIEENYKKLMLKNGKKSLKDTSFLSGTSVMTQKSLRERMIVGEKEVNPLDFNLENLERDESEIREHEGKIYLPPRLPSKSFNLKNQNQNKAEIDTSSYSFKSNIKELELTEEVTKGGPRQVKFQSEKVSPKARINITEQETTDRGDGEENVSRGFF